MQKAVIYRLWWRLERNWHRYSIVWYSARLNIMKKFTVIIENKNYRTKSHTSINAYNVWNRNWQIVDKQMIFELCYIEAIIKNKALNFIYSVVFYVSYLGSKKQS